MDLTLPFKDLLVLHTPDVSGDVTDIVIPICIAKDLLPQSTRLFEVHCEGPVGYQANGNGKTELTLCNLA